MLPGVGTWPLCCAFAFPPEPLSLFPVLLRMSLTLVEEEVGVAVLELFGDLESLPATVFEPD